MTGLNIVSLVRNLQIWADRNGNNNQVYGDDSSEIIQFNQRLEKMNKNGQLSNDDIKAAMGYCTTPQAEHWQSSNNKNAKSVLKTFASDMDFESKATILKQLFGEENVAEIFKNRDWARPIVAQLKDGTMVTYNRFRQELSYKNENVEKYYYQLDTGEFIEEIKQK